MKRFIFLSLLGVFAMADSASPMILSEMDSTLLTTNVRVVVRSGAAKDPLAKAGLTNLYTELMIRGTKKRSRSDFQSTLERMGATLGVAVTHDNITFYGSVIKENTVAFLKLVGECFLSPSLSAKEFQSLKREILAELAHIKNSNNRLSGMAIRRKMFAGSILERTLQGSLGTIKKLTLDDVKKAYKRDFHQGNVLFAIATAVDEKQWAPEFNKIWKGMPKGEYKPVPIFEPKAPKENTLIVVHKPKTSTGSLVFGRPGLTVHNPYRYTLKLANFVFGEEALVSRLFRIVRGELGWTYAVYSTYETMGALSFQPGMYFMVSTPAVEFTGKTLLKLNSMWQTYATDGLKQEELSVGKESQINSYPFEFATSDARLSKKIYSFLYRVPILSVEEFTQKIGSISNDDIIKAIKATHQDHWYIAVVADKEVIKQQLAEEQKELPANERLTISEVINADQLIQ